MKTTRLLSPVAVLALILGLGVGLGGGSLAHAIPWFNATYPPVYGFQGGSSTSYITYDAVTDHFTSAPFRGFWGQPSPGERITGTGGIIFDAIIDEAGNVVSGSALWIGGIPELGIPEGTTLLTGTMLAVSFCVGCSAGAPGAQFNILFDVDYSNPVLGPLGPLAGAESAGAPSEGIPVDLDIMEFAQNPFRYSFTYDRASYVAVGSVHLAPEPSTLLLLGSGLAGLGGIAWRRNRRQ